MGKSDLTLGNEPLRFRNVSEDVLASKKPPGGLEDACLRFPKRRVELSGGFPGEVGKSDLTLGNEPLRFRNVSEDDLAPKKPPGGLEDACLRFPKRGVELPGGFLGGWRNQI